MSTINIIIITITIIMSIIEIETKNFDKNQTEREYIIQFFIYTKSFIKFAH